jgi:hypothetical protein
VRIRWRFYGRAAAWDHPCVRALAFAAAVVVVGVAGCGGSAHAKTAADARLAEIAKSEDSVLARVRAASDHRPGTRCSRDDLRRAFTAAGVKVEVDRRMDSVAPPGDDPPFFVVAAQPDGSLSYAIDTRRKWAWATIRHVQIGADTHVLGVVDRIVAAGC